MTDKNIQLLDKDGNLCYPKTKANLVLNNNGDSLGTVEAGAQNNVIESIEINGELLPIDTNKKATYTFSYEMVKQSSADDGYASTYYLAKDGAQAGVKINIAKDQVLDNVERKICQTADIPEIGYKVGDIYWEFTFQNTNKKLYINLNEFVDVYTNGNGLTLFNKIFAIDTNVVCTVSVFNAHANNSTIHITDQERTEWNAKQNAITSTNKLDASLIGTDDTHRFVTDSDKANWNAKQNPANTLAGYGITDALTYSIIASV